MLVNGSRLDGWRTIDPVMGITTIETQRLARPDRQQEVRFCRGADGTRLAWAASGSGPPLIVVSCWLSHLQHDWESPVWRHFLEDLSKFTTLIRYDERGFGMSDWNVTDFTLEARHADLEAIVAATGLERFAMLGVSGGSSVALAYAARHPERVTRLILNGTVCGEPVAFEGDELAEEETYRSMIRVGWAKEDPVFRRVFTRIFIPAATEEQMQWFDALQRAATSPDNAVASRLGRQAVDIVDEIPRIAAPTLILQSVDDHATTFDNAVQVAGLIPDARLVALDSANHILLADEPAWATAVAEMRTFMEPDRRAMDGARPRAKTEPLSPRELDVLREAARGMDNAAIAAELGLSPRTVERHLSNAYGKLGVTGRSARAAAVAEVLRRGSF
jgi:pimeloyl-ACP methyl ester carboxylesterase/DNA-binding CsgD family transcriptional regulator